MFNDYVWQTYLNAGGKDVVEMFRKNFEEEFSEEFIDNIVRFRENYCPSKTICNGTRTELTELLNDVREGYYILEEGSYNTETAMKYLYNWFKEENENFSPKIAFEIFCKSVEYFTTFLALECHELFVPYYYQWNFNVLEKIALEFEIDLPKIPIKKDYEGRFYYYSELCEAFLSFRKEHNLTEYEFMAFLYDFAPSYIGGTKSYIVDDLPEPKGAFFIGASADDDFLSNEADTITPWQCNVDTAAGDMIVMYLRTPISAVDSIWRSVSVGFNDPLFYYYRCTYIAKPTAIRRIALKELQEDIIFKDIPIVRKNMQGINGVELKPSEYNHIIDMSGANVLKLNYVVSNDDREFVNEKAVEDFLIKPLLKKLGYRENDYVQQLNIEIGNHNHRLIPDFVLLPEYCNGYYSAFAIVEAKRSISSSKQLKEVIKQARSYARQLGTKYAIIVSKENIWLTSDKDCYTNVIFSSSWEEMENPDVFRSFHKLVGR
ncbi:MAG: hypothetical protein PUG83_05160 [Clostridiaceae bacterium]|nr:hypothetical protein [Clostridiaceae bacterium]MDY5991339.1 hypothetical protein [Oscillospiraceae bacterium]